ncbi:hypothetical protein CTA1_12653 [Colletotrichum tanaceti]|uniref:Uncharacterized protein n=1 Tax=Colletotrichum tanaceti TaxID=1306861 RepID=A0A4U6XI78_9PEZI|nr:hypothetical protein CTA1_12653 [Colletotrichum tanaceti]
MALGRLPAKTKLITNFSLAASPQFDLFELAPKSCLVACQPAHKDDPMYLKAMSRLTGEACCRFKGTVNRRGEARPGSL